MYYIQALDGLIFQNIEVGMEFLVALTDHVFPEATLVEQIRSQVATELQVNECLDEEGLVEITHLADAVIVERAKITAKVIDQMERCKIIVRHGVGYDTLDVDAATKAGICVCNVTDYCTQEVADHAMALLLALSRSLFSLDRCVRAGGWRIFDVAGGIRRIDGMVLGLIGYGKIGQAAANRAKSFGMKVLCFDPYVPSSVMDAAGVVKGDLEEVLGQSDAISLHLPLSEETHHLLNAERLRLMKPTAFVINTARGGLIDQKALVEALVEGRLAGAGLDTLEKEPPAATDPILQCPNVILSPHAAFYSQGSLRELHFRVARRVAQVLVERRCPDNLLNPAVLGRARVALS